MVMHGGHNMSLTAEELYLNTSMNDSNLWEINEEMAKTLVPSMVFIGVLMMTGLAGNIFASYIFIRCFELSVMIFLFIVLAVLDLVSSSLAMPFEIVDMRYGYIFKSEPLCKGFRFIVAFPTINSIFVLLIITVDRYRRVCMPMKPQMNLKKAKLSVMFSTLCALLMSLPATYLYGVRKVQIGNTGVWGFDCTIRNNDLVSFQARLYHAFGTIIMISICIALCVMYICIWREIRSHSRFTMANTQLALAKCHRRTDTRVDKDGTAGDAIASGRRVTVISFLVTTLFIVSYVPFVVSVFIQIDLGPGNYQDNPIWFPVNNILLRSYFISSVGNPVIYGFMSKRFRRMFSKLWVQFFEQCFQ